MCGVNYFTITETKQLRPCLIQPYDELVLRSRDSEMTCSAAASAEIER
jgi:hypothetical protein